MLGGRRGAAGYGRQARVRGGGSRGKDRAERSGGKAQGRPAARPGVGDAESEATLVGFRLLGTRPPFSAVMAAPFPAMAMGVAIYLGLVGGGLVAAFVATTILKAVRLI